MKHLKTFEELKPSTYNSAARKLKKMGQFGRSDELKNWASKVAAKESLVKWNDNVLNMSKYGVFKLNITNEKTGKSLVGDFYLDVSFDGFSFLDSYMSDKDDAKDVNNMKDQSIFLMIGIIPTTEELINKCSDIMPSSEFDNGFYWGLIVKIGFDIVKGFVVINEFIVESFDKSQSGVVGINDRASAGRFKTLLKNIFSDPKFNYPSGMTDVSTMWENLERTILIEAGVSSDHGFELTDVAKFINGVSPNTLVKPI